MLNYFKRNVKNDRGAVAPIIGLSILTLLVFIGVAIDMGRYFLVRNKMLTALDAAVLGASRIATARLQEKDPGAITARGIEFFRANFPANLNVNVEDSDIKIDFNPATGQVNGSITDAEMPLVFAGIFKLSNPKEAVASFNIDIKSQVVRQANAVEIALVLDFTPSMCFMLGTGSMWDNKPRVPDPTCEKFNTMKTQAVNFINTIQSSVTATSGGSASYSFIPFSHSVRIDNSVQDFNFCFEKSDALPKAIGLTRDPTAIISTIQNTAKAPEEGGSNIATAMWWGWSSLKLESQSLFAGSSAAVNPPVDIGQVINRSTQKVLLLLTDGENEYPNYSCDGTVLSGDKQGFRRDFAADDRFAELCASAKQEGVTIYTVAFDVPDNPNLKTRVLLNNCANPGQSYNATNTEQLAEVFDQIASNLINLRITK